MNTIDLKQTVATALAVRWDAFAACHPNLAGVIDQTLLIENVSADLTNDAEFQQAMTDARAVNAGMDAVLSLVDRFVVKYVGRLVL